MGEKKILIEILRRTFPLYGGPSMFILVTWLFLYIIGGYAPPPLFFHSLSCWEKLLCVEESFSFVFPPLKSTGWHWQGVDEVSGQRLRPCCFLHWSGTCLTQTQLIHMQPALLHLLKENLTNPKRPQMARKCFTHKQHCSPSIPDEHDAVISLLQSDRQKRMPCGIHL